MAMKRSKRDQDSDSDRATARRTQRQPRTDLALLAYRTGDFGTAGVAWMGAKIVSRLAADLKSAFPGIEGFSRTNLLYMRAFAEAYPDSAIVQQLLDNSPIPWGHQVRILDKVKDTEQRLWYIRAACEYGWSRAVLEYQIETNLYGRQGKALTNFT